MPNSNTAPLRGVYSRSTNSTTNYLHERTLRLIYHDYELIFEEFLDKDDHSLFIIIIFRRLKYTITCLKFSATCLHEAAILVIYARNLILSFRKYEQY